jgi:RimJ/RimL family protein N-acetyltransferase
MTMTADLPSTVDAEEPGKPAPREARRGELAEVLQRGVAELPDNALLNEDLDLDSLAMMSLIAWLDSYRVTIDTDQDLPRSIGEVLGLVEKASAPGVSVTIAAARAAASRERGMFGADQVALPAFHDPLAPILAAHGLYLTPVTPDDMGFLYGLAVRPETCFRWRYRGAPPSVERFQNELWMQVLVQYVVKRTADNQPVGHIICYGCDPAMQWGYIGAVFTPQVAGTGLAANAVAMFVRYLFHCFPFRKLYLEVPGFNWAELRSGEGRFFHVEGVLKEHNNYAGRLWDQYLCAMYREEVDGIPAAT